MKEIRLVPMEDVNFDEIENDDEYIGFKDGEDLLLCDENNNPLKIKYGNSDFAIDVIGKIIGKGVYIGSVNKRKSFVHFNRYHRANKLFGIF